MCNISGYIGNKRAAPILLEMLKKQAGFCGGYYTGITTIYNGKLYTAKVIGDVDRLIETTDAMNFPGNIGIIHSRSESGGDVHWAHPFNSNDNKISTVFNGALGKYVCIDPHDALVNAVNDIGATFESAVDSKIGTYPVLKDGRCVQVSECLFHLTMYEMVTKNLATHKGLQNALLTYPSEIVGLGVCLDEPDRIAFVNHNMPMFVGTTTEEVFLGSMALCFPTDRDYIGIEQIPHSSSGEVYLNKIVIERFVQPLKIGKITPDLIIKAKQVMLEVLKTNGKPCTIGDFNKQVKLLFGDLIDQRYPVVYEILREMLDNGIVEIVKTVCDGAIEARADGVKTTQFTVKLKESVC